MMKEGKICALLESKGVPNIAPFGKGNDVRDYMSLTHTLRDEKWACWSRIMVLLRQYRMSLDVVARHLTSFNSSREFVSAIANAMAGKRLFAHSDRRTNFSLPQHINMPISTLMSFIVTSARNHMRGPRPLDRLGSLWAHECMRCIVMRKKKKRRK
jgi:hypothetical protein